MQAPCTKPQDSVQTLNWNRCCRIGCTYHAYAAQHPWELHTLHQHPLRLPKQP